MQRSSVWAISGGGDPCWAAPMCARVCAARKMVSAACPRSHPAGDKFLDLDESTSDDDIQVVDGAAGFSRLGCHGYVPGAVSQVQQASGRNGPSLQVSMEECMPGSCGQEPNLVWTSACPTPEEPGFSGSRSCQGPCAAGAPGGAGCEQDCPVRRTPLCPHASPSRSSAAAAAARQPDREVVRSASRRLGVWRRRKAAPARCVGFFRPCLNAGAPPDAVQPPSLHGRRPGIAGRKVPA